MYNLAGELVRVLDLGEKKAGVYDTKDMAVHWDGRSEAGQEVASGVYFYQLQVNGMTLTRKMIVVK
ncbi:MAG: FlgD immunoglobulin-like domain containing protein [bacterium]|nr:FlgD immunoglobulin-like domain containing protein [bacterium]